MPVLLERLRAALGADYEILDEVGGGGMGVVYRARDRALDRLVAIKIVRPDLTTAAAAERFLHEARLLASFRHPNIIPVHRAGEADGLPFYVMDFLDGETLAARLMRGPLKGAEARRIADDLLTALDVVHAQGIVHRDVKPSNIVLVDGRAVLLDFGISKSAGLAQGFATAPGWIVGTPGYMPPEQEAGGEITPRTDQYAAAMVIYELYAGRSWSLDPAAAHSDWGGVPAPVAAALRKALALGPADRWAGVAEFRAALTRTAAPWRRWAALSAVVLAAMALLLLRAAGRGAGAPIRVAIHSFSNHDGGAAAIRPDLASRLVRELRAAPDIDFRAAGGTPLWRPDLEVEGRAETMTGGVRVALQVAGAPGRDAFTLVDSGTADVVLDRLASALLLGIWQRYDRALGRNLPVLALPRTPGGLTAWARAEALWARAQWGAADSAYGAALAADPTCLLCMLRLSLITRWMRQDIDPALTARLVAGIGSFTPPYQQLIRADMDSLDRWTALAELARRAPDFELAQFVYGDELFHRGPLAGIRRVDALEPFRRVARLRPDFAPGWEHLAWLAAAVGDSALADSARMRNLGTAAGADPITRVLQALLEAGFAWRFTPPAAAARRTDSVLLRPEIAGFPALNAAGRYLASFDAPAGVVWIGERFAGWRTRPDLLGPGLVAQVSGLLALGRADSALRVGARLRGASSDAEYALSAAEFDAANTLLDSLDARAAWPRLSDALAPLTRDGAGTPAQRRRAAWMLSLLARRAGSPTATAWRARLADEPAPHALATFLDADEVAGTAPGAALARSAPLLRLDSSALAGDPFFRAVLHVSRARWSARTGNLRSAVKELRWHENSDLVGLPPTLVDAVNADWAFGTLGRWYRARLLDRLGMSDDPETCDAYAGVARLWHDGDPPFARRAEDAAGRVRALRCGGGR
jgi:hypothetical protein